MIPNTVTWSVYRDGMMINRVYRAPDDEIMDHIVTLLGPLIMEGMISTDELQEHAKLQTGVAVHHPENL